MGGLSAGPSVLVVTGASRGMGRACLERLRGEADVLVAADLVAPEVDGALGVACDVADPGAVADLAERAASLGALRGLVHAAGISPTMGDARRILEVNLVGTQLLLDAFESQVVPGTSAVCFASSAAHQIALAGPAPELDALVEAPLAAGFLDDAAGRVPDSGMAYAWSKRGVQRAAARAALTWGARGGRVNSVSPGIVDTGMGRQELEQQPMMQVILDHTPVGRLGRAEEIAALVAFLVSDAASFVTGVDVLADGGAMEGLRRLASGAG